MIRASLFLVCLVLLPMPSAAVEPDYSAWDRLLARYYDPARGFDYAALKRKDSGALRALREKLGLVDLRSMSRDEELAYWINLYNVNVVAIVVDAYPVKSIRDISTDPIRRLNVFERDLVPFQGERISLDKIEHERIRKHFKEPRIHFAINCAARGCPPLPEKAVRGSTLEQVLETQTRAFLNRPGVVQIDRDGASTVVRTTRIMDWFREDFESAGGSLNFIRNYLAPERLRLLVGKVRLDYTDYDWSLNERR